jgi:hypothetical protein
MYNLLSSGIHKTRADFCGSRFHYWLATAQVTMYGPVGQRPLNCHNSIIHHKRNVKNLSELEHNLNCTYIYNFEKIYTSFLVLFS